MTVSTERILQHISTSGLRKIMKEMQTEHDDLNLQIANLVDERNELFDSLEQFKAELEAREKTKAEAKEAIDDEPDDENTTPTKLKVTGKEASDG